MRDPRSNNSVHLDINTMGNNGLLDMTDIPPYEYEDWEFKDPKDFTKFIKYVEQEVRGSTEYQQYIQYLRNAFEMNRDSFFMNISNAQTNNIKIEIHHEPLTLYDITLIVFRKRQAMSEDLSEESIAKEIMWCHYNGLVGLIPLSQTIHELVHSGVLFIPTTHVYGNYKLFIEMYKPYFTIEQNDILNEIERQTENFDMEKYKELLELKETYILDYNKDYNNHDIIESMSSRKQEIYDQLHNRFRTDI